MPLRRQSRAGSKHSQTRARTTHAPVVPSPRDGEAVPRSGAEKVGWACEGKESETIGRAVGRGGVESFTVCHKRHSRDAPGRVPVGREEECFLWSFTTTRGERKRQHVPSQEAHRPREGPSRHSSHHEWLACQSPRFWLSDFRYFCAVLPGAVLKIITKNFSLLEVEEDGRCPRAKKFAVIVPYDPGVRPLSKGYTYRHT